MISEPYAVRTVVTTKCQSRSKIDIDGTNVNISGIPQDGVGQSILLGAKARSYGNLLTGTGVRHVDSPAYGYVYGRIRVPGCMERVNRREIHPTVGVRLRGEPGDTTRRRFQSLITC